jgi:hypothetical protein
MIIVHLVVDYHPLIVDNTAMLRRHLIDRLLDGFMSAGVKIDHIAPRQQRDAAV